MGAIVVERKYFTCPSRESNPGRWINRQTLNHVAVSFYSDVVECLPVDPATWVRFPAWAGKYFRSTTSRYIAVTNSGNVHNARMNRFRILLYYKRLYGELRRKVERLNIESVPLGGVKMLMNPFSLMGSLIIALYFTLRSYLCIN